MKNIFRILIFILSAVTFTQAAAQDYATSSVLKQGTWLAVKVVGEGVVRINYSDITALGLGGSDPVMYGNNYGLLSYYNDDTAPDDLEKIAIKIEKGADAVFNQGDYLLFYAESTHRWEYEGSGEFSFKRHNYSDTAVYFITAGSSPDLIQTLIGSFSKNNDSEYRDLLVNHEVEQRNILKSGREWYQPVSVLQPVSIAPGLTGESPEPGEDIQFRIRTLARSAVPTIFRLNRAGGLIESIGITEVNLLSTAGTYARSADNTGAFTWTGGDPGLTVSFHNNGDNSARGWLDYLQLHARVRTSYRGKQLKFTDFKSAGPGNITRFSIASDLPSLIVWDITDGSDPVIIPSTYSAGEISFTIPTESLKRFVVFSPADALSPAMISQPLKNQDLHSGSGYDMIIVTHPLFREYAEELAMIHAEADSYSTVVVTPDEIYNEFSGGIKDISAIRNYVRMIRDRGDALSVPLKNLLLFGDGSYENITPPPFNPSFIPTYQTQNSNVNILSFTSDDFFGLLDAGEGESTGYIDIGIGRLPVSTREEAADMIEKIRRYTSPEAMGQWRNIVCMAADDEDNNLHMGDAEALSGLIGAIEPEINIEKIYFDSYPQETSISGDAYPAATRDINERIADGCLIFNYLGHGNELGLAHERVVKVEDIISWRNRYKMPLFITATCEFSRYDDIEIDDATGSISRKPSAGEMVLLNPDGGGIALLTTTRIVYSAPNFTLNNQVYQFAFTRNSEGEALSLGEILKLAKNNSGSGDNKRSFTLLGDPAVRLSYPWHGEIVTDSINGIDATIFNDTINALSTMRISGHIENTDGEMETGFNGLASISFYDKSYRVATMANDGGIPYEYEIQDRVLFRGKAEVNSGLFTLTFLVPKDIDYSYGLGKLSFYAGSGDDDYQGYFNSVTVGGFNNIVTSDTTGPVIRLFINDTLFRPGGITDSNPVLLAYITDPGGINTTGTGIGHDIVTFLDDDRTETTVLNNYFENDPGSYTSGWLEYSLHGLDRGAHSIFLKAWDNYNNSGTEELKFIVETDGRFILNRLVNYPNPFIDATSIRIDHNRPDKELEIRIDIYSINGTIVKQIVSHQLVSGFSLEPIVWDGLDNHGSRTGAGIYVYTVTIKTSEGETASKAAKMIILR